MNKLLLNLSSFKSVSYICVKHGITTANALAEHTGLKVADINGAVFDWLSANMGNVFTAAINKEELQSKEWTNDIYEVWTDANGTELVASIKFMARGDTCKLNKFVTSWGVVLKEVKNKREGCTLSKMVEVDLDKQAELPSKRTSPRLDIVDYAKSRRCVSLVTLVAEKFIPLPEGCTINDVEAIATNDNQWDAHILNVEWVLRKNTLQSKRLFNISGVDVLETCGYGYTKHNQQSCISRQIKRHGLIEGRDYIVNRDGKFEYSFSEDALNMMLSEAMTKKGNEVFMRNNHI